MSGLCRFDLDLYEEEYDLDTEGVCDNCREYEFERVNCPKHFVDYGDKGTGPYLMCEDCCDDAFSREAAECLTNDCEIADKNFLDSDLEKKESIFANFLSELSIGKYTTRNKIFTFDIGGKSIYVSLDRRYEKKENLSNLEENIELIDAYYFGEYSRAFKFKKQWYGMPNNDTEFLRGVGFLVNKCDLLESVDIKTPFIRFNSPMGIYGYTNAFFIDERYLKFIEIYPYNIESVFRDEYEIPYFYEHGAPFIEKLEKKVGKNIHYKLVRALGLIQNKGKLKINQRIEILHFLSTYFDLAFKELYNAKFNDKVENANSALYKLIEEGRITSNFYSNKDLNNLRKKITRYKSKTDFEKKILSLIYLNTIKIRSKKLDLSYLNQHFADLLISILIRNFFAHRADLTKILRNEYYNYSKNALFSSIMTMDHIFNRDDYSIVNDDEEPEDFDQIDENLEW